MTTDYNINTVPATDRPAEIRISNGPSLHNLLGFGVFIVWLCEIKLYVFCHYERTENAIRSEIE